jgi:hypothetical protein
MSIEPEIRITGANVRVLQGRKTLAKLHFEQMIDSIHGASEKTRGFEIRPQNARIWEERGNAVAAAFELPPHARTVRWLADDSTAPYGPKASYRNYYVGLPYVVLLLVFRAGALTGQHQLYYRTEPLDAGEELRLPNLYNVAEGYGQRCWVCLQNLGDVTELSWPMKISRILDYVFSAAFNRSSEEHEGNSYWTRQNSVDPRVASMKAWEEATREDRRVGLAVPWEPAGTTASTELRTMLDRVVSPRRIRSSAELAALISRGRIASESPG